MDKLVLKPRKLKWIKRLILSIIGFIVGTFIGFGLKDLYPNLPQWLLMTIGLVLMGYCVIMILMSRSALSGSNKGLVLNKSGISDQSSIIGYGDMPWKEVTEILIEEKKKFPRILVMIKKPQSMIDRSSNNAIKGLRQKNFQIFGTPVLIETESFDVDLDELMSFLNDRRVRVISKTF